MKIGGNDKSTFVTFKGNMSYTHTRNVVLPLDTKASKESTKWPSRLSQLLFPRQTCILFLNITIQLLLKSPPMSPWTSRFLKWGPPLWRLRIRTQNFFYFLFEHEAPKRFYRVLTNATISCSNFPQITFVCSWTRKWGEVHWPNHHECVNSLQFSTQSNKEGEGGREVSHINIRG